MTAAETLVGDGSRPDAGLLAEGDQVLLLDRAGNRRLIRLKAGAKAHGHKGYLEHDRMIGEPEGVAVRSSSGTVYVAVRPRLADYALEMPRRTAIVYPKDIGIILVWADVFPGASVFEAGFGSGSLTLALLRAVGPSGRVVVYEVRTDVIPAALANIRGFEEPRGELVVSPHDPGLLYAVSGDGNLWVFREPSDAPAQVPKEHSLAYPAALSRKVRASDLPLR